MSDSSVSSGYCDEANPVETEFYSCRTMSQRTDGSSDSLPEQPQVLEESIEQREKKERNKIAQRKRRIRQRNELHFLRLENAAFASREAILRNQHFCLSQKNKLAIEENEQLQQLVDSLTDQLSEAKKTFVVHQNQLRVWKGAYDELLQRTSSVAATSSKRSAEEAELTEVQQRRSSFNSFLQRSGNHDT